MKGWNSLIAIAVIATLVVSFLPVASGVSDSMKVIMTIEDMDYKAGDTITIEIFVYQNGVLTDVPEGDAVEIQMSTHYNLNNPENLAIVHPDVGHYTASHVVTQDDNHLYFFYNVEIGTDDEAISHPENTGEAIHVDVFEFHNTVDVNFDGQDAIVAHPGDTVTATIEVRYGTTLLDVNGFNSLVAIKPDGNETALTASLPISQGIYEASYTIPNDSSSGAYSIYAAPDTGGHDEAIILVNVMDIWYRLIDIVGSTATFEVGVADLEGQPVADATVYVDSGAASNMGTTNESGLVLLSLTDVWGTEYIEGFAISDELLLNQSFEGFIINEDDPTPSNHGFDILYNGEDTTYSVSEVVSRQYTAYYNAAPQSTRQIYYYITASGTNYGMSDVGPDHIDEPFEVTSYGVATTDAGGKFTLDFTAPTTQCELNFYFESGFTISDLDDWISDNGQDSYDADDNLVYDFWPEHDWEDGSYAFVTDGDMIDDSNVKVAADDFTIGEATGVTVTMPADYDDSISAMWIIGEVDIDAVDPTSEQEWFNWAPGGDMITLTKGDGNEYTGTYTVPTFISSDSVFIYSGYNDGMTGFPHYNYDEASEAGSGELPVLWVIIIVIIIAVVGVGVLWYFKNN